MPHPPCPSRARCASAFWRAAHCPPAAETVDDDAEGTLARAIKVSKRFEGKIGQILSVPAPHNLSVGRIVLLGLGEADRLTAEKAQQVGGSLIAELLRSGDTQAAMRIDGVDLDPVVLAANLAFGARLRSYRFDKYKTVEKPEKKQQLKSLKILTGSTGSVKKAFAALDHVASGGVHHAGPGLGTGQPALSGKLCRSMPGTGRVRHRS